MCIEVIVCNVSVVFLDTVYGPPLVHRSCSEKAFVSAHSPPTADWNFGINAHTHIHTSSTSSFQLVVVEERTCDGVLTVQSSQYAGVLPSLQ